jgi:hypothetical protein
MEVLRRQFSTVSASVPDSFCDFQDLGIDCPSGGLESVDGLTDFFKMTIGQETVHDPEVFPVAGFDEGSSDIRMGIPVAAIVHRSPRFGRDDSRVEVRVEHLSVRVMLANPFFDFRCSVDVIEALLDPYPLRVEFDNDKTSGLGDKFDESNTELDTLRVLPRFEGDEGGLTEGVSHHMTLISTALRVTEIVLSAIPAVRVISLEFLELGFEHDFISDSHSGVLEGLRAAYGVDEFAKDKEGYYARVHTVEELCGDGSAASFAAVRFGYEAVDSVFHSFNTVLNECEAIARISFRIFLTHGVYLSEITLTASLLHLFFPEFFALEISLSNARDELLDVRFLPTERGAGSSGFHSLSFGWGDGGGGGKKNNP